jgi:hypothetical protein
MEKKKFNVWIRPRRINIYVRISFYKNCIPIFTLRQLNKLFLQCWETIVLEPNKGSLEEADRQ